MTDVGFLKGTRVCVAISGGVDSVCLLHKLKARSKTDGFSLCALHVEHGIRGKESKEDARFVQEYCKSLGVPLFCFEADCIRLAAENKVGLEEAAREFRLSVYRRVLDENKADWIATAHHLCDEAETVLFRLARGSSLTGVRGMSLTNGRIVRPLLTESKEEILRYAKENGLSWREDRTNGERDATRNKLRLDVLPSLESAMPGAKENLARFARIAGEDDELLYRLSEALLSFETPQWAGDTGVRLAFSSERPLFRRACLTALKALGVEKDYTFEHLERVYALQTLQTGSKATLPRGIVARRQYDCIVFEKDEEQTENEEYEVVFSDREEEGAEGKILRADRDKIPENAAVRFYREGDTFRKFGGGTKPLKKYFADRKILQPLRKHVPLLAERDGEKVFAVCGVEIADEIKVDEGTERTVYIILRKKKGE